MPVLRCFVSKEHDDTNTVESQPNSAVLKDLGITRFGWSKREAGSEAIRLKRVGRQPGMVDARLCDRLTAYTVHAATYASNIQQELPGSAPPSVRGYIATFSMFWIMFSQ